MKNSFWTQVFIIIDYNHTHTSILYWNHLSILTTSTPMTTHHTSKNTNRRTNNQKKLVSSPSHIHVLEYKSTLKKKRPTHPCYKKCLIQKKANLHFFTTFSYKKSSQKFRAFICKWHYFCFFFNTTQNSQQVQIKAQIFYLFVQHNKLFFSVIFGAPLVYVRLAYSFVYYQILVRLVYN